MRERLVSVVGGRAIQYVGLKKPSDIIPFRGKFPILEPYQIPLYIEEVGSKMRIEDLSKEFQEATEKGNRIAVLENGFKAYLSDNNISVGEFLKLSNSDKSDYLMNWLNKDCIDFSELTIK